MRLRPRVSFVSAALLLLASAGFVGACSLQGEGERCSTDNNNDDCQAGLVCKPKLSVCCPDDVSQATTDVCRNGGSVVSDSGTSDGTADTGTAEVSDDSATDDTGGGTTDGGLGAPCVRNSDCIEPYACDKSAHCNYECVTDRDCTGGKHCWSDQSCHDGVETTDSGTDTTPADTTPADTSSADTGEAG